MRNAFDSSRAPWAKSLDVRRRTLAPHSGEAATMPEKSGANDQPASQPAFSFGEWIIVSLPGLAWAGRVWPCLPVCLPACLPACLWPRSRLTFPCLPSNSPPVLQSIFTRRHSQKASSDNSPVFHFSSARHSGLCSPVSRASGLRAYLLHACLHIRDWAIVIPPARRANTTHACLGRTLSLPQPCPAQTTTSRSLKVRHVCVFVSFASVVTQPSSQLSVCFLTKSRASGDLVKILFPASPRPPCASSQIGSTLLTPCLLFSSRANYLAPSSTSVSFVILPRHPHRLTHPQPSRARPYP